MTVVKEAVLEDIVRIFIECEKLGLVDEPVDFLGLEKEHAVPLLTGFIMRYVELGGKIAPKKMTKVLLSKPLTICSAIELSDFLQQCPESLRFRARAFFVCDTSPVSFYAVPKNSPLLSGVWREGRNRNMHRRCSEGDLIDMKKPKKSRPSLPTISFHPFEDLHESG